MEGVYEEHNLLLTTYSIADSQTMFLFENLAPRSYKGIMYVHICTGIIVISREYVYR
jgi:hypothetical protein